MSNAIAKLVATCFFIGYSPCCPGTIASALTALGFFFMPEYTLLSMTLFLALFIPFFIWSAGRVEKLQAIKDPSCIVIDEFVGMLIALIALPKVWWMYLLVFILFRIFDITKPFPVRQAEKYLPGGIGIVMDDVL